MTWLSEPAASLVVPVAPPIVVARADDGGLGRDVPIGENGDPLVDIPGDIAVDPIYDRLPLPARGRLRLRKAVIERLRRADAALPEPFGLTVLDGWRPPAYQVALLTYYRELHPDLPDGYVADPDHGGWVPGHTTGGAVDLTLSIDGVPVALGTDFDAFDERAAVDALEGAGASTARDLRRLLAEVLLAEGFAPYPQEWWHWSYGDQWWAVAADAPMTLYGVVEGDGVGDGAGVPAS